MRWLLPATAIFGLLALLAILVLTSVSWLQETEDRATQLEAIEDRNEERAESNRRLLERLTAVMESMERSAREHRCQSELALLQQTDLIRFGHTHPDQYVPHLAVIGCGEFLPVLPGLPTTSAESRTAPSRRAPPGRELGGQPDEDRAEPDDDNPDDDPDDEDGDDDEPDDDPPDEDPPLVCVNPPLVPPVCVG